MEGVELGRQLSGYVLQCDRRHGQIDTAEFLDPTCMWCCSFRSSPSTQYVHLERVLHQLGPAQPALQAHRLLRVAPCSARLSSWRGPGRCRACARAGEPPPTPSPGPGPSPAPPPSAPKNPSRASPACPCGGRRVRSRLNGREGQALLGPVQQEEDRARLGPVLSWKW